MNKPTYNVQCSGVHVVHTDSLESILGGGTNAGRVNGSTTTDTSSSTPPRETRRVWLPAAVALFVSTVIQQLAVVLGSASNSGTDSKGSGHHFCPPACVLGWMLSTQMNPTCAQVAARCSGSCGVAQPRLTGSLAAVAPEGQRSTAWKLSRSLRAKRTS